MTNTSDASIDVSWGDASDALSIASAALSATQKGDAPSDRVDKCVAGINIANDALRTGSTIIAGGAAVTAASGLTVAATSGAGIATGLAAAGSVVGGGMAMGPVSIAVGPACLSVQGLNRTLFRDSVHDTREEIVAKRKARAGTKIGGAVGIAGVGAAVASGGASGPAIMTTLASVGSLVGGGALSGVVLVAAAPIAAVFAGGYAAYRLHGGGKKKR